MNTAFLIAHRQKLLIAGGIGGLVVLLAVTMSPRLKVVAKADSADSDDEILALVDDASAESPRAHATQPPKPFRRGGAGHKAISEAAPARPELIDDAPMFQVASAPAVKAGASDASTIAGQVTPPSYRSRLALLEDEQELLRKRAERRGQATETAIRPAGRLTVTTVEASDADAGPVVPAVSESRDPKALRQVRLVSGSSSGHDERKPAAPRGAWLNGSIEIE